MTWRRFGREDYYLIVGNKTLLLNQILDVANKKPIGMKICSMFRLSFVRLN